MFWPGEAFHSAAAPQTSGARVCACAYALVRASSVTFCECLLGIRSIYGFLFCDTWLYKESVLVAIMGALPTLSPKPPHQSSLTAFSGVIKSPHPLPLFGPTVDLKRSAA